MNVLIVRLESVLQSWGERSAWDHRDTAAMPTKSGVIGLLGCCLGYPRSDARLAELGRQLQMAVRADRPGTVMMDYHTVQNRRGNFPNAAGGTRDSNTIVTPREYLEDACFTVFLAGEDSLLETCARALRNPVWVPSLGRRSCPPTYPLLPVLCSDYASLEEAARRFCWTKPAVARAAHPMLCELDDPGSRRMRCDLPIDSARGQYAMRGVRLITIGEE